MKREGVSGHLLSDLAFSDERAISSMVVIFPFFISHFLYHGQPGWVYLQGILLWFPMLLAVLPGTVEAEMEEQFMANVTTIAMSEA